MILYHTSDREIRPAANDTIFDTIGIMSSGYLKPEDALQLLMVGPEYMQIAIKTEKAAKQLRFTGSEKIGRMDGEQLKEEQDVYQEAFALELGKILEE